MYYNFSVTYKFPIDHIVHGDRVYKLPIESRRGGVRNVKFGLPKCQQNYVKVRIMKGLRAFPFPNLAISNHFTMQFTKLPTFIYYRTDNLQNDAFSIFFMISFASLSSRHVNNQV